MNGVASVAQARAPYALARALAATAVVVTGALAAHTWAGGTVPTTPGLVLVTAVVLAGGLLCFTREVPVWALLPAVGAAQLGLHGTFGLAAEHTHHVPAGADPGRTWQMVGAHLFVTVLTAALWWVARRAASYVVSFGARCAAPMSDALPHRPTEVVSSASLLHLLVSPRRGPPLAVLPT